MPRVLFLSRSKSTSSSAYDHRLKMLSRGLEQNGIRTHMAFLGDRPITSHTMLPVYIPYIGRLCRDFDIIHAGAAPCAYVAILSKPFHRKKIIHDFHGDRIAELVAEKSNTSGQKDLGRFPLIKALIQETVGTWCPDYYLAVSKPLKELLVSRGVNENKIALIRNGVDLSLFKTKNILRRKYFNITYAGKFQSYQAVDDFVNAIKRISNPKISFRIIGFSQDEFEIKQKIHDRLKDRAELLNQLPQNQLINKLIESDVLVIPRKSSKVTQIAFPTKFAEYIALAKPVLVSDVDETSDFVRSYHCGLVYREGDIDLAEKMVQLFNLPEKRIKQMGKNARSLAEKVFNWEVISKIYSKIIFQLVK